MPTDILMPQLSPTMTEGRLSGWLKKEGEKITAGDVIAEVETDKATMEVEASTDGVLHKIIGKAGDDIPVGTPIAVMAAEGEKVPAGYKPKTPAPAPEKSATNGKAESVPVEEKPAAAPVVTSAAPQAVANMEGATGGAASSKASPLARRMAREAGLSLAGVTGSGPHGRVVRADVERMLTGGRLPARAKDTLERHTPMRKSIAGRLTAAKQHVPHFYLSRDVYIDTLLDTRRQLNENAPKGEGDGPLYKLSVNDFIIRACAMALREVPAANAGWNDEGLVMFGNVDISVAVAIPGGLITPVLKNAEQKSLPQLSNEMKELAGRARDGKLKPEEYEGGTFSISNLGMYGIKEFQAIINPPQAAILACGAGEERPVVDETGNIAVATVVSLSLSVDHRVIDGALGAELLAAICNRLENPATLLV